MRNGSLAPYLVHRRRRREIRRFSSLARVIAFGEELIAFGEELIAEGEELIAFGEELIAEGEELIAEGEELIAEGEDVGATSANLCCAFVQAKVTKCERRAALGCLRQP